MEVFHQIIPMRRHLENLRCKGMQIGFVPTMGALHSGHIALLDACKKENDVNVCSIFVNPIQFNNQQDFKKYPRKFTDDFAVLEVNGCDVIFQPDDSEIYKNTPITNFSFGVLDNLMEGSFRPGHFNGVALVVAKLLNIVQPHYAYFGQKDLQQFMIVKKLITDLSFNTTLVRVPTQRDPDGLALSSRNQRLNDEQRKKATVYYQALKEAELNLKQGKSVSDTKLLINGLFGHDPEVSLEYFEIVDESSLKPLNDHSQINGMAVALCIAGYLGSVRLIDNLITEL